jgi:hypothetical protein
LPKSNLIATKIFTTKKKNREIAMRKTGKKSRKKIQSLRGGIGGSKNQGARVINPIRNAPDTIQSRVDRALEHFVNPLWFTFEKIAKADVREKAWEFAHIQGFFPYPFG